MNKNWLVLPVALLAAAGCNSNKTSSNTTTGNATANGAAAAPSAAPAPAPAPAPTPAPTAGDHPEQLVGRWSPSGNCANYIDYRADGTLTGPTGINGTWATQGEGDAMVLVMNLQGDPPMHSQIRNLAEDSFDSVDSESTVRMTRCP